MAAWIWCREKIDCGIWSVGELKVVQGSWNLFSQSGRQSVKQTLCQSQVTQTRLGSKYLGTVTLYLPPAH